MEHDGDADSSDALGATPDLRAFMTYRISRLQAKLNRHGTQVLSEMADLTLMQWRTLAILNEFGPASVTELSHSIGFDKAQVSRAAAVLVEKGLLAVTPVPADDRKRRLSAAPAGEALFKRLLPIMRRRQARLMRLLDADERAALFGALDKLEAAVEADLETPGWSQEL